MIILVLNAGSSSLKFRLFRMDALRSLAEPEEVLASGQVERIGKAEAQLTFRLGAEGAEQKRSIGAETVSEAAQEVLTELLRPVAEGEPPVKIDAVGHRIVHGGARFYEPTRIDDTVLHEIHALTELAPLHNPSGLAGIEAVQQALPDIPNVAVFDTAFHHRLPEVAARYALPSDLSERLQLRRYGFHGISYRYVSERLALIRHHGSQQDPRVVICHLGNGASVCALRNGQSIDTSMGFTPLEGLLMGNRSGDVDPGLLLHLLHAAHMTPDQLNDLLNHQSGLLGLSGKSSDVRDLEKAAGEGDPASQLALDCFAYRVRKYIGAYAAALGGIDTLVFTGGIGEHSASMRARICHDLDFLGLRLDDARNQSANGKIPAVLSDNVRNIWIVPTDEERQIARETFSLVDSSLA
ncbi:MAG: acetate kinase [Chthonomonadales bacterium]|nr:acetate kinase [Chthonomonadales bacterium]